MQTAKKIILVGGGIGGAATALALHRAGFEPVVYDNVPCATLPKPQTDDLQVYIARCWLSTDISVALGRVFRHLRLKMINLPRLFT